MAYKKSIIIWFKFVAWNSGFSDHRGAVECWRQRDTKTEHKTKTIWKFCPLSWKKKFIVFFSSSENNWSDWANELTSVNWTVCNRIEFHCWAALCVNGKVFVCHLCSNLLYLLLPLTACAYIWNIWIRVLFSLATPTVSTKTCSHSLLVIKQAIALCARSAFFSLDQNSYIPLKKTKKIINKNENLGLHWQIACCV